MWLLFHQEVVIYVLLVSMVVQKQLFIGFSETCKESAE